MKILSRDFTVREKVLMTFLSILLIILAYYRFVDIPVRDGIVDAKSKVEAYNTELNAVNTKIESLRQMQEELDELGTAGRAAYMASYNNAEAEYTALNDILSATDEYVITFSDLTREGDLIRREFSIQYTTTGYAAAKKIIFDLENSKYRCRIGDLSVSVGKENDTEADLLHWNGRIMVSAKATFYETMVGGTADEGLPAEDDK